MKHMTNNITFTMLKPDSIEKGNIGPILEKITALREKLEKAVREPALQNLSGGEGVDIFTRRNQNL